MLIISKIDTVGTIDDKESFFNVKILKILGKKYEAPLKTIDAKNIKSCQIFEINDILSKRGRNIIEISKLIGENTIENIINQPEDYQANKFFGVSEKISKKLLQ